MRSIPKLVLSSLVLGSASLLLVGEAQAAKFGVKVLSEQGTPLAGIAVCVGTHGNYKRFGAQFTSATGDVMVDVPNVPLIVTISKNRFSAMRVTEPARKFNLVREFRLKEGVPGPRCVAGSSLAESNASETSTVELPIKIQQAEKDDSLDINSLNALALNIEDVYIDRSAKTVNLATSVTGEPSHFRISSNTLFDNAAWQDYQDPIELDHDLVTSLYKERTTLFLQMRRYRSFAEGWIEARSNIVDVRLPELN